MGGDVTVASEQGKGSVFTVRLPAGADSMTADSVGLGGSEPAVAGWILVIDDDAIARDLIADNLKLAGFSVSTSSSGPDRMLRGGAITLADPYRVHSKLFDWQLQRRFRDHVD